MNNTEESSISMASHPNDLKTIGAMLQRRRQELNLSLKEAENATSIRTVYLQSLEEGSPEKLIAPVYAQGFFKQYAGFLGLDGDKIVRENPELFNKSEPQHFAYGIGTLEHRNQSSAGVKWFPNALWISAFVLSLLVIWYIARIFEVL
jgi:cytoskeletal protein RodZ